MSRLRLLGRGGRRKHEATFVLASREYVTVQGLKGLKCDIVCYFQSRIFNPTNLLNQVPPFVEWIMQMFKIVTQRCSYSYDISHICITSLTEGIA